MPLKMSWQMEQVHRMLGWYFPVSKFQAVERLANFQFSHLIRGFHMWQHLHVSGCSNLNTCNEHEAFNGMILTSFCKIIGNCAQIMTIPLVCDNATFSLQLHGVLMLDMLSGTRRRTPPKPLMLTFRWRRTHQQREQQEAAESQLNLVWHIFSPNCCYTHQSLYRCLRGCCWVKKAKR